MASWSTESNLAPVEFDLSTSFESSGGLTVAIERCPLCVGCRKPYYCKKCVGSGCFVHSRDKNSDKESERYSAKHAAWVALKTDKGEILQRFKSSVSKRHEIDQKRADIDECKRKIVLLKLAIAATKETVESGKNEVHQRKKENTSYMARTRRHAEKKAHIRDYLSQWRGQHERRQSDCTQVRDQLMSERRSHVEKLVQYIFPVEQVQSNSEVENMALSTVRALKDASQTAYVKGRWVYTDNGGDMECRIVETKLPGNGDYSAYHIWVAASRESDVSPNPGERNPGHNISAGLGHISQLLLLLAHILQINLPRRLCYSEFGKDEIPERQFNHVVSRLNQNILYLCLSQGVDHDYLHPNHSLQNILRLLHSPALGSTGPFEVTDDLSHSLDDSAISEDSDDDRLHSDDEVDIAMDWEKVPTEMLEIEVPTRGVFSTTSTVQTTAYTSQNYPDNTQLTASSLVTSAAASVASFFRAATGQSDKR
ncbi:hypothetical protein ScPMuIL_014420 [Solemya velum]